MTPKSSAERLSFEGDVVKAWVHAPPAEGEANEALVALVAKRLGLPKSRVALTKGGKSRGKILQISGITPEELTALLKEKLR